MIQKSNYEAPAVELFGISPKTSILTLSDGKGAQSPIVQTLATEEILSGAEW